MVATASECMMISMRGLEVNDALSLSPPSEYSGMVRSPSQRTLMYVDLAAGAGGQTSGWGLGTGNSRLIDSGATTWAMLQPKLLSARSLLL